VKILVVKPSSLGDVVHTFPAVRRLRNRYPKACIGWVVNESLRALPAMCPDVDEVIVFPRSAGRDIGTYRRFLRTLRAFRADLAVDFQGLLRSGLIAWFSGASRRVGFRRSREGAWLFYTESVRIPGRIKHAVERNAALAAFAAGEYEDYRVPPFEMTIPPEAETDAGGLLAEAGGVGARMIAVAPGARWETKIWPASAFASALDAAVTELPDVRIVLVGSAAEQEIARTVARLCRAATVTDLTGRTDLPVLCAVLRAAHAMLTNDSGPMHLAAALGAPVAAVFGPTDPERTGPYGSGHVVLRGRCPDAPCFRKKCRRAADACWEGIDPSYVGVQLARLAKSR